MTPPRSIHLSFALVLHEEEERRALEGELWRLERAWKAAEEIAAIADDLLIPAAAETFVNRHSPRQAQEDGESTS